MTPISNFAFLKHYDELLFKLAETAERCFVPDPNTTLVKMRQPLLTLCTVFRGKFIKVRN